MPSVSSPSDAETPSADSVSRRWKYALAKARLRPSLRGLYANEISRFLRYCTILHVPVTSSRAREYMRIVPLPRSRPLARDALRWFFNTGFDGLDPKPCIRTRARRMPAWPAA